MIVVDSELLAALWVPTALTRQVEQVLQRDAGWAAPVGWRSELRAMLARAVSRHEVPLEAALSGMEGAESLLRGQEYQVPSDKVMRFAVASGCPAYACEYAVLAEDLGVPLVTVNDGLLRGFPKLSVPLKSFVRPVAA